MCWLRQLDTYPATIVAPLSKGDAAAVPLVSTFSIHSKRQMDCYRASPLERGTAEPGVCIGKQMQKVQLLFKRGLL